MIARVILPALVAIGSVSAQSATCTVVTTTINSQADATGLAGCKTVRGSVLIAPQTGASIDISGPGTITGDLILLNNGEIQSFRSDDLTTIGGTWEMKNVTALSTLSFASITKVKALDWQTLNALDTLSFTSGLTQAEEVTISDTFLSALTGIDLTSVKTMRIDNNRRLTSFTTQLRDLSDELRIQANGQRLEVNMPNLTWIANMIIANVTKFSAPSLVTVNNSAKFDFNYFSDFSAPNLTRTQSGDISFVGNVNLKNISMPRLTTVGGGLLIANNTALIELNGLPALKTISGAVKLRGSFDDVSFPALNDVKGAFDLSSTGDIEKSCTEFKKIASAKDGGSGKIQGTYSCTSNNANANSDTSSTTGTGGGTSKPKPDAAAGLSLNTVLLGFAGLAGLAQALL
ncbi:hypothetical protein B0T18DRAFT_386790 [Schizothecium vesticola]|uniref:GPI-anchored cell wall organization protein Ecm33 n=1 Tax=Schizothecium vesticola TaxID=314040 RepID=A0AA40FC85_9PEZI|nr:hypothetical protein B0T18DRAFT_386790 [Schizothecium vesticola]